MPVQTAGERFGASAERSARRDRALVLTAVLAALGSAFMAALSTVLHHRAGMGDGGVGVVLRPLWLLGSLVAVGGLGLHAVALQQGQLSVVQPLLVSGLLFALPLAALFDRRRVGLVQMAWAAVVVMGLALFLVCARPAPGQPIADPVELALASASITATAAGAVLAGAVWRRHRAALWAVAGGCGYGLVGVLLKDSVGLVGLGFTVALRSWELYGLVVVGIAAIAVSQAAFNAGPLAMSLPALTIADPVVAVVVGAVLFGERTASAPGFVVGQAVGFVAMTGAVVALTRFSTTAAAVAGPGR